MRALVTRRWVAIHGAVLLAIPGLLALGWWQYTRAGEGNARSIGYAFEWPTFALIIIVMWIKAMRDEVRGGSAIGTRAALVPLPPGAAERALTSAEIIAADEADDPELAAYNERLAALHAHATRRGR